MSKAIVVYETRYGNTKQVAETIIEGIKEVGGMEVELAQVKKVERGRLAEFDIILIGAPNHIGRATRNTRKFTDQIADMGLEGKLVAFFDTYIATDFGKAVGKLERQLEKKAPHIEVVSPGLSIKVDGIKGPVSEGELPKCREFGIKLANMMKERSS